MVFGKQSRLYGKTLPKFRKKKISKLEAHSLYLKINTSRRKFVAHTMQFLHRLPVLETGRTRPAATLLCASGRVRLGASGWLPKLPKQCEGFAPHPPRRFAGSYCISASREPQWRVLSGSKTRHVIRCTAHFSLLYRIFFCARATHEGVLQLKLIQLDEDVTFCSWILLK